MIIPKEREHRQMVPRWRDTQASYGADELRFELPRESFEVVQALSGGQERLLSESSVAWLENQQLGYALDLLSTARIAGHPEVARDAAEFVLDHGTDSTPAALASAREVLGLDKLEGRIFGTLEQPQRVVGLQTSLRDRVRQLRGQLAGFPHSPLHWLNLAWTQTALVDLHKAERSLRTALGLALQHRLLLRAATRYFVHQHDFEQVAYLLRTRADLIHDPWLISAEIATSALLEQRSPRIRAARGLLERNHLSPFQLSEVAAALGTLEFCEGNSKTM